MGQVYRARDTRLGRTVAIKVLPPDISNRPGLRERFEREAQTISSLNHPHICVLHDVGHYDGIDYLVMEFLEGETLASRLERGPVPPREAIRTAIEIGDALDKAHRQGIVHRDLKPANVMLTKNGAKLLDFGLAKLRMAEAPVPVAVTAIPTDVRNLTVAGTVLGTLQYMAPEQLEGKEADARSDIFAYGVTVYEMVTGVKAFQGKTQVSLMAAILEQDPPPITSRQPIAPAALDAIVDGCVAKDPDERWQSARDVVKQLKAVKDQPAAVPVADTSGASTPKRERFFWAAVSAAFLVSAIVLGVTVVSRREPVAPLVGFEVPPPAGGLFPGANNVPRFAVSPDGQFLAFEASVGRGKPFQMWIRRLDSTEAQPLAPVATDSNALQGFFWSPDSKYVGFFDQLTGKLKKIDLQGGPPQTICDVGGNNYGGTWNADGVILLSSSATNGVLRVSANGGVPTQVTTLDKTQQETRHGSPRFLPDGRHFLYHVQKGGPETWAVYVGSLDSADRKMLIQSEFSAEFAPPNVLLFIRGNALFAQRVDLKTFDPTGEPLLLAAAVGGAANGRAGFHASNNGVLVYSKESDLGAGRQLLWVDRAGNRTGPLGPRLNALTLKFSPDGKSIAFSDTSSGEANDIWIHDVDRGLRTRLTTDAASDDNPVWSPDGSQLIFNSTRDGVSGLYQKPANGATPERLLYKSEPRSLLAVRDWSHDGRFVLFDKNPASGASRDLWVMPLSGDRKPFPYLVSGFDKSQAALSPNARWVAYVSIESGLLQVVVQPFPDPSKGKWQVSTDGGIRPRWRADGKELYYQNRSGEIVAVSVTTDQQFEVGKSTPLFRTSFTFQSPPIAFPYDAAPDGERFVISEPIGPVSGQGGFAYGVSPLTVVLNWLSLLKP